MRGARGAPIRRNLPLALALPALLIAAGWFLAVALHRSLALAAYPAMAGERWLPPLADAPVSPAPPAIRPADPLVGVGAPYPAMTVSIVSYNIHHGAGLDEVVDLDRTAAALRELQPDIIFLAEVDAYWPRSGNVDQLAELAARLEMPFQYYAPALSRFRVFDLAGLGASYYGNGLLARFPIAAVANYPLPRFGSMEPRNLLVAQVAIAGRSLTVLGTHLGLNRDERREQVAAILDLTRRFPPDRVFVGDLNASLDAPEIQDVQSQWVDAWNGTGDAATFPSAPARRRIDYAFVSPQLKEHVLAYETPALLASDHRPVVLVLAWSAPSEERSAGNRP